MGAEFGARNIARIVEEKIKGYFVDAVLFGELQEGGFATADVLAGEVIITPGRAHETAADSDSEPGRDETPAEP